MLRASLVVASLGFVVGCGPSATDIAAALDAHLNAKEVDAALAMFVDDAAMKVAGNPVRGKEELKAYFERLAGNNTRFTLVGERTTKGKDVVSVHQVASDEYTKLGVGPLEATTEITIVQGKITDGRWELSKDSAQKLNAVAAKALEARLLAFEAALSKGDVAATLAMLTDDATLRIGEETLSGQLELKMGLEALAAQHFGVRPGPRQVDANELRAKAFIVNDEWKKLGVETIDATVEATVVDDKVKFYSVGLNPEALEKLAAAEAAASAAPPVPKGRGKRRR